MKRAIYIIGIVSLLSGMVGCRGRCDQPPVQLNFVLTNKDGNTLMDSVAKDSVAFRVYYMEGNDKINLKHLEIDSCPPPWHYSFTWYDMEGLSNSGIKTYYVVPHAGDTNTLFIDIDINQSTFWKCKDPLKQVLYNGSPAEKRVNHNYNIVYLLKKG